MRTYGLRLAIAIAASIIPRFAWAQHEAHQGGAQASSAELAQCLRVQPVIDNIITAAMTRAEAARLSNNPTEMRAAVESLEAALRDIRAQSASCSTAAASTDPRAGHTMPTSPSPSTAPEQTPAGGVDPHAGHTMPSSASAPKRTTLEKPAAGTGSPQAASSDSSRIESWLTEYDAAFNAKDLDKLATFYHPDVTIYEGGGINNGWVDYRDRHLGPELKAFENLQFEHSNTKVTVLLGGQSAYATSEYSIKAKVGERDIDSRGLETLVLLKDAAGNWKIRHSHTSSRPARKPAGQDR
jgi:ketosteroid isomerase-like protein